MTILTDLIDLALLFRAWMHTPEGTNLLFALICVASLLGMPARSCLCLTLLVHVVLILL